MFTIFTTCRDSVKWPAYGAMQYNAIKSWTLLNPSPQVIVVGNDPGTKELCDEIGVTHVPEVETEEDDVPENIGVPIFSSMVKIAEDMARDGDTMLCMSSDIIVFQSIVNACEALKAKFVDGFCGVAQRFNKKIHDRLTFKRGWEEGVRKNSKIHNPCSGDIFLFPKGFWKNEMPPFQVGRSRVDTWMFWYAYNRDVLVDMTHAVNVVHHLHPKFEVNNNRNLKARCYQKNTELAKGNCYGEGININKANWILNESFHISRPKR